jgi:hypothetical protein
MSKGATKVPATLSSILRDVPGELPEPGDHVRAET